MITLLFMAGWGLGLLSAPHCILACGAMALRSTQLSVWMVMGYHLFRWVGYAISLVSLGYLMGLWPLAGSVFTILGALGLLWWTFLKPGLGSKGCKSMGNSCGIEWCGVSKPKGNFRIFYNKFWSFRSIGDGPWLGFIHCLLTCPMIWAMAALVNRLNLIEMMVYTGGFVLGTSIPFIMVSFFGKGLLQRLGFYGILQGQGLRWASLLMSLWLVWRSVWPYLPNEIPLRGQSQCGKPSISVRQ